MTMEILVENAMYDTVEYDIIRVYEIDVLPEEYNIAQDAAKAMQRSASVFAVHLTKKCVDKYDMFACV